MLQIKPLIREHAIQKNGLTSIYLRLTYSRESKYFSTRIRIHHSNWDEKKNCVKKTQTLSVSINLTIETFINNMNERYYEMYRNKETFSFSKVIAAMKGNAPVLFLDYATKELANRPVQKDSKKAPQSCINNVEQFKKGVLVSEIDNNFLNNFKNFLIKKGHSHNTVIGGLTRIRSFMNAAVRDGIIKESPFEQFTVGSYMAKQEFITMKELMLVYNSLNTLPATLGQVCKQFCFMCFTSLRYSDLKQLDYSMLNYNDAEKYWFYTFKQQKTKGNQSIPLSDLAISLIDTNIKKGKVFKVGTNQYCNRILKEAFEVLKIDKHITTHMGRHTFITLSMQMGVSKDIAGKIAGHKQSSTTDGYAHLQIDDLYKGVQKWNTKSPDGG